MLLPKGDHPEKRFIPQTEREGLILRIKSSMVQSLPRTGSRPVAGNRSAICFSKDEGELLQVHRPRELRAGGRKMNATGLPKSILLLQVPLRTQDSWEGTSAHGPAEWLRWPMANKSVTSCGPYLTFGHDEYLECVFCGLEPKVNHSLEISEPQGKN